MNKYIIIVLSILLMISLYFNFKPNNIDYQPLIVHDTIQVDSIRIEEHTKIQYVQSIDTFTVVERDTLRDTIYFQLPIEHKEYQDTLRTDTSEITLDIKYSGFKATLDEINITNHYWKDMPVNQKKWHIKPSFNIGLGGGMGLGIRDGCLKPEPQVGIYGTVGFSVVKY